jgi:hypothetical protein
MLNVCTKNISEFFENTEVFFLPGSTTLLLQALDQAIVIAFKVTYAVHLTFPSKHVILHTSQKRAELFYSIYRML